MLDSNESNETPIGNGIMANRIAKVIIDSLQEVVHEKSIGTKMKDLDLCLEVV